MSHDGQTRPAVPHWLADDQVIYECRRGRTTPDEQQDTSPTYGPDDIVAFDPN